MRLCHYDRCEEQSEQEWVGPWNRRAWWSMCLAARCLYGGELRWETRIHSCWSIWDVGQTTAAAEGTLLHISATQQSDNHNSKLPITATISGHVQKHSEEQYMTMLKNTMKYIK